MFFLVLISTLLILISCTTWAGAGLTLGLIGSAITMRLTRLGIKINNDRGALFHMALGAFILSVIILL